MEDGAGRGRRRSLDGKPGGNASRGLNLEHGLSGPLPTLRTTGASQTVPVLSANPLLGPQRSSRAVWKQTWTLPLALFFILAGLVFLGANLVDAVRMVSVPLPPLLYGHSLPSIGPRAFAIGGAIPQPPSLLPKDTDPLSSTVYTLDIPGALGGGESPWTVDAAANLTVGMDEGSRGTKPPPLLNHCAVTVGPRILVLFGQTTSPDGSRIASSYPPLWFDPVLGTWEPLKQEGKDWITPPPRYLHSCAFHGARARVFVFGGVARTEAGGEEETNELWTLDVNDGWWEEVDLARTTLGPGLESVKGLDERRVGSSMHIVNGASNYLFICFGAPALNLPPNDPSCHVLDIAGVYPSNITLLPSFVLNGLPPTPRVQSGFSTKIPYENSVMFGYGGYDGTRYLEDLFAIDASGLPASASWIPVVPTPQYPKPNRYRPGPRASYGRLVPLPLPVQTSGMPQPQLLWGGSTVMYSNLSRAAGAPLLPNASDSLGTLFALDPATWGWEATYPIPNPNGESISLWDQPAGKWAIAGVCLGVTVILAAIMIGVCWKRGGCSDPGRKAIPVFGRLWRDEVKYEDEVAKGKSATGDSGKLPKATGAGELLASDPWKQPLTTNQVSPVDDPSSPIRRVAATLSRSFSMVTGNRLSQHPAATTDPADPAFLEAFGPHASAAFERRSLATVGSKRDNLAAAAAAGLLVHPPDRHSRTQSKRHSVGGLPTNGDDSDAEDSPPGVPDDVGTPGGSVPLVPTHYVEELPVGMTMYDLFSTPQPPPSFTPDAEPIGAWEGRRTRVLTYDLSAGPTSQPSPTSASASGKPPMKKARTGSLGARSEPNTPTDEVRLMVSNPDLARTSQEGAHWDVDGAAE